MKIFKHIVAVICLSSVIAATAQVRYFDRYADMARADSLIGACVAAMTVPERMDCIGRNLVGTPYVAHTLEATAGQPEQLVINLQQLDCTTFVESVTALALAEDEADFPRQLAALRYRDGKIDGYASRLHYIADWADYNMARGVLTDVAATIPSHAVRTMDISFMSGHRNSYPALTDESEYARILEVENRLKSKSFAYIPKEKLADPEVLRMLHPGDIIAFVSYLPDLDVTHMGLIVSENGELHALHASSSNHKVEISDKTLPRFVHDNRYWTGIRVFRLSTTSNSRKE